MTQLKENQTTLWASGNFSTHFEKAKVIVDSVWLDLTFDARISI